LFPFPARAVAFLKENNIRGNIALPFDWGEYVLWHLGPGVKVSIDGRRETVYSDQAYRQSRDFERGTGDWSVLVDDANTDLILLPIGSTTARLLAGRPGWVPLYGDSFCILFAREGHVSLSTLVGKPVPVVADDGKGLCFPAPGPRRVSVGGTTRFAPGR
jgi:hypothetical protein